MGTGDASTTDGRSRVPLIGTAGEIAVTGPPHPRTETAGHKPPLTYAVLAPPPPKRQRAKGLMPVHGIPVVAGTCASTDCTVLCRAPEERPPDFGGRLAATRRRFALNRQQLVVGQMRWADNPTLNKVRGVGARRTRPRGGGGRVQKGKRKKRSQKEGYCCYHVT